MNRRGDLEEATAPWLRSLGFRFDPFHYLESSDDVRLGAYLVRHELAGMAWDGPPTLVFAPAGGGKTTLRMYAAYACWLGQGYGQVFPLPYLPEQAHAPTPIMHLAAIAQGGAVALLIGLAHFPRRLLDLGHPERRAVATLLDAALPAPLSYYLDQLRSDNNPARLARRLEKSYRLPTPTTTDLIAELCSALEASLPQQTVSLEPHERFELLKTVILDGLRFRKLVIQIDNLDSIAETINNPEAMAERILWPLEQAVRWAEQGVILNAFLPSELEASLGQRSPELLGVVRQARVVWSDTLLAEVIRLRLGDATGGLFNSLDAVSSPSLKAIEATIVAAALPLPREVILLTSRVLAAYAQRVGEAPGQIQPGDLDQGLEWYSLHRVDPGPLAQA